jgi:hypothetical protein
MNADTVTVLVRRRIESRYRRICFVQRELAKIAAAARKESADKGGASFCGSFGDFVFSQIDFSMYQTIGSEEFSLLFDAGLFDFDETFYQNTFQANRKHIREIISRSYIKTGAFYACRQANPLILSIMRSLHVSLDFAPLFSMTDFETSGQYRSLAAALDSVVIRHDDGMETRLFVPEEGGDILRGTFHPLGKAHTITLIPA